MTTPTVTNLPLSSPPLNSVKRKRVLLLDDSTAKRDVRAEAMRSLGMEVDCACDISEARSWWRADLYNLVIINMGKDSGHVDRFCEDIRAAIPPQKIVFLVGKPEYLSPSPNQVTPAIADQETGGGPVDCRHTDPFARPSQEVVLPWGIMEASRRISAVRSVWAARSMAMRNRPLPPRDQEGKASRRAEVMSQLASELQKEELL